MSDVKNPLPDYLSASSIQTFIQCPLKFKLSRVDKIQEPPTMQTLLGNFVHDVLEHFYKEVKAEERTVIAARASCTTIWNEGGWADRVAPHLGRTKMNDFRWSAWWCVENIFLLEEPQNISPVGLEYEVLGEIDGVLLKGYIDRWTEFGGRVVISDYKTGKTPAPQYMADKWFQLSLYALLIAELHKKEAFELELLYLKDGVRRKLQPSQSDFQKTKDTIITTKKEIIHSYDNDQWPTIPSNLCNWCFYKSNLCTYWNPADE